MSHTASRKGGYGKSPERKTNGRVTRRQDDKAAALNYDDERCEHLRACGKDSRARRPGGPGGLRVMAATRQPSGSPESLPPPPRTDP